VSWRNVTISIFKKTTLTEPWERMVWNGRKMLSYRFSAGSRVQNIIFFS
jgi:hypothetical protein